MSHHRSMRALVQEYLDERRRLGFSLMISGSQLMAFARFADHSGHHGPLNCRIILDWVQGQIPHAEHITWARRLEVVRPFAKYRARFDPRTEIPDADLFGKGHRRLTPHIYSDQEIIDLLRTAREMTPQGTLRPATYEALFGLIAATGVATGSRSSNLLARLLHLPGSLVAKAGKDRRDDQVGIVRPFYWDRHNTRLFRRVIVPSWKQCIAYVNHFFE